MKQQQKRKTVCCKKSIWTGSETILRFVEWQNWCKRSNACGVVDCHFCHRTSTSFASTNYPTPTNGSTKLRYQESFSRSSSKFESIQSLNPSWFCLQRAKAGIPIRVWWYFLDTMTIKEFIKWEGYLHPSLQFLLPTGDGLWPIPSYSWFEIPLAKRAASGSKTGADIFAQAYCYLSRWGAKQLRECLAWMLQPSTTLVRVHGCLPLSIWWRQQ